MIRREMNIISNGSKWDGESPDSVETLISVLETETLDPGFEIFGKFVSWTGTGLRALGNFLTVSHVFNIEGSLEEMLPLARAIKAASRRPEYLAAKA
jgi:hypothetical protein